MQTELRRIDDERIKRLEDKVDIILEKVSCLPCRERFIEIAALKRDIGWIQKILYTFICMAFGGAVTFSMMFVSVQTTVERNTNYIEEYLHERSSLSKTVRMPQLSGGIAEASEGD